MNRGRTPVKEMRAEGANTAVSAEREDAENYVSNVISRASNKSDH